MSLNSLVQRLGGAEALNQLVDLRFFPRERQNDGAKVKFSEHDRPKLLDAEQWGYMLLLELSLLSIEHSNKTLEHRKEAISEAVQLRQHTPGALNREVVEALPKDIKNAATILKHGNTTGCHVEMVREPAAGAKVRSSASSASRAQSVGPATSPSARPQQSIGTGFSTGVDLLSGISIPTSTNFAEDVLKEFEQVPRVSQAEEAATRPSRAFQDPDAADESSGEDVAQPSTTISGNAVAVEDAVSLVPTPPEPSIQSADEDTNDGLVASVADANTPELIHTHNVIDGVRYPVLPAHASETSKWVDQILARTDGRVADYKPNPAYIQRIKENEPNDIGESLPHQPKSSAFRTPVSRRSAANGGVVKPTTRSATPVAASKAENGQSVRQTATPHRLTAGARASRPMVKSSSASSQTSPETHRASRSKRPRTIRRLGFYAMLDKRFGVNDNANASVPRVENMQVLQVGAGLSLNAQGAAAAEHHVSSTSVTSDETNEKKRPGILVKGVRRVERPKKRVRFAKDLIREKAMEDYLEYARSEEPKKAREKINRYRVSGPGFETVLSGNMFEKLDRLGKAKSEQKPKDNALPPPKPMRMRSKRTINVAVSQRLEARRKAKRKAEEHAGPGNVVKRRRLDFGGGILGDMVDFVNKPSLIRKRDMELCARLLDGHPLDKMFRIDGRRFDALLSTMMRRHDTKEHHNWYKLLALRDTAMWNAQESDPRYNCTKSDFDVDAANFVVGWQSMHRGVTKLMAEEGFALAQDRGQMLERGCALKCVNYDQISVHKGQVIAQVDRYNRGVGTFIFGKEGNEADVTLVRDCFERLKI